MWLVQMQNPGMISYTRGRLYSHIGLIRVNACECHHGGLAQLLRFVISQAGSTARKPKLHLR